MSQLNEFAALVRAASVSPRELQTKKPEALRRRLYRLRELYRLAPTSDPATVYLAETLEFQIVDGHLNVRQNFYRALELACVRALTEEIHGAS